LLENHAQTAAPTATGGPQPTGTGFSGVTNGCSDKDEKTTGTRFVSKFHERPSFTMFCNSDTQNGPLTAVFTGTFDTCMEACGSWNNYINFNNFTSPNCNGVTFVPGWLNLTRATADRASGSCFLKAGLNRTTLVPPVSEMEVHSALLEEKVGSGSNDKRNVPVLINTFWSAVFESIQTVELKPLLGLVPFFLELSPSSSSYPWVFCSKFSVFFFFHPVKQTATGAAWGAICAFELHVCMG
jgi:hypothetical protein